MTNEINRRDAIAAGMATLLGAAVAGNAEATATTADDPAWDERWTLAEPPLPWVESLAWSDDLPGNAYWRLTLHDPQSEAWSLVAVDASQDVWLSADGDGFPRIVDPDLRVAEAELMVREGATWKRTIRVELVP